LREYFVRLEPYMKRLEVEDFFIIGLITGIGS